MLNRIERKNVPRPLGLLVRLWHSYWLLPALMICATIALFALLRWLDAAGAARWLRDGNVVLTDSGTTMADGAQVAVGVTSAIATLYVSITLLVLTIAAGNLGVRLIDRWIARPFIRFTLGFFLAALALSLAFLLTVDDSATPDALPHGPSLFLAAVLLVELVWLALALQDLGRAVFVDTAIGRIRDDSTARPAPDFARVSNEDWEGSHIFGARWQGYVRTTDIDRLSRIAHECDTEFRLLKSAGDHVLPGEPLLQSRQPMSPAIQDRLAKAFLVCETRGDEEGLSYRVRLLVEIAARALSPAINDIYTARACVDALVEIMLHHKDRVTEPGKLLQEIDRVACPTASFQRLFDTPLDALRQAAAKYPSIAIRLIERMGTAAALSQDDRFAAHVESHARRMRDHGIDQAELDADAEDIARAYSTGFGA
ncbi:DUF2254 family protein [Sphingomicrobium sp. XHP0239]|uniref:DUF2254 family protein n=1 Tax=Sphingomicrobium maritimum TaxID=3133972 RepID=UPI0031CCA769